MASSLNVRLPSLDGVFEQYGLSKEELNTPCSTDDCTELAMKLDKWELLAQVIGLTQADCTAIKANSWISYEQQRVAALVKWKGKFGSRATYLNLAEGLKKIDNLDLVEELCKIYKRHQFKCILTQPTSRKANSQQNIEASYREVIQKLKKITSKTAIIGITLPFIYLVFLTTTTIPDVCSHHIVLVLSIILGNSHTNDTYLLYWWSLVEES